MYQYTQASEKTNRSEVMERDTYYKAQEIMKDVEAIEKLLEKIEHNNTITFNLRNNPTIRTVLKDSLNKMRDKRQKELDKL
jgi:hypothetical protein